MEDINERSQLGYRMLHLSKDAGVSDFYITPWEPLTYKRNGKLFFDSFIYQPERPLEFTAGCVDYALTLGWSWIEACKLGNLMGSIKIASRGPQNHAPSRVEIDALLHAHYGSHLPG